MFGLYRPAGWRYDGGEFIQSVVVSTSQTVCQLGCNFRWVGIYSDGVGCAKLDPRGSS